MKKKLALMLAATLAMGTLLHRGRGYCCGYRAG